MCALPTQGRMRVIRRQAAVSVHQGTGVLIARRGLVIPSISERTAQGQLAVVHAAFVVATRSPRMSGSTGRKRQGDGDVGVWAFVQLN